MKKDAEALIESYWAQLEAYVYAFESPLEGEPKPIKAIGLLQWRIDNSLHLEGDSRGFSVDHRYICIERRPEKFQGFLEKFIGIIEGDFPESGANCENCKFLAELGFSY